MEIPDPDLEPPRPHPHPFTTSFPPPGGRLQKSSGLLSLSKSNSNNFPKAWRSGGPPPRHRQRDKELGPLAGHDAMSIEAEARRIVLAASHQTHVDLGNGRTRVIATQRQPNHLHETVNLDGLVQLYEAANRESFGSARLPRYRKDFKNGGAASTVDKLPGGEPMMQHSHAVSEGRPIPRSNVGVQRFGTTAPRSHKHPSSECEPERITDATNGRSALNQGFRRPRETLKGLQSFTSHTHESIGFERAPPVAKAEGLGDHVPLKIVGVVPATGSKPVNPQLLPRHLLTCEGPNRTLGRTDRGSAQPPASVLKEHLQPLGFAPAAKSALDGHEAFLSSMAAERSARVGGVTSVDNLSYAYRPPKSLRALWDSTPLEAGHSRSFPVSLLRPRTLLLHADFIQHLRVSLEKRTSEAEVKGSGNELSLGIASAHIIFDGTDGEFHLEINGELAPNGMDSDMKFDHQNIAIPVVRASASLGDVHKRLEEILQRAITDPPDPERTPLFSLMLICGLENDTLSVRAFFLYPLLNQMFYAIRPPRIAPNSLWVALKQGPVGLDGGLVAIDQARLAVIVPDSINDEERDGMLICGVWITSSGAETNWKLPLRVGRFILNEMLHGRSPQHPGVLGFILASGEYPSCFQFSCDTAIVDLVKTEAVKKVELVDDIAPVELELDDRPHHIRDDIPSTDGRSGRVDEKVEEPPTSGVEVAQMEESCDRNSEEPKPANSIIDKSPNIEPPDERHADATHPSHSPPVEANVDKNSRDIEDHTQPTSKSTSMSDFIDRTTLQQQQMLMFQQQQLLLSLVQQALTSASLSNQHSRDPIPLPKPSPSEQKCEIGTNTSMWLMQQNQLRDVFGALGVSDRPELSGDASKKPQSPPRASPAPVSSSPRRVFALPNRIPPGCDTFPSTGVMRVNADERQISSPTAPESSSEGVVQNTTHVTSYPSPGPSSQRLLESSTGVPSGFPNSAQQQVDHSISQKTGQQVVEGQYEQESLRAQDSVSNTGARMPGTADADLVRVVEVVLALDRDDPPRNDRTTQSTPNQQNRARTAIRDERDAIAQVCQNPDETFILEHRDIFSGLEASTMQLMETNAPVPEESVNLLFQHPTDSSSINRVEDDERPVVENPLDSPDRPPVVDTDGEELSYGGSTGDSVNSLTDDVKADAIAAKYLNSANNFQSLRWSPVDDDIEDGQTGEEPYSIHTLRYLRKFGLMDDDR
ncbi:hypothetical protein M427DRAFT_54969 [Gonapodya prolifera JEL478]|uniref:Uncharacterized protein n=1 Tax=Gonapodya prolifera (strain JEL478) TaxID=1344416 RepID=A0A139AJG4_GONPJ|nr:hypothetical protein M427DRAFT_54969 [Gonapodya prolifera JEL478]|eukprot:KXS16940.1 hypothetical protein M427DRAFT_54969 [Gonapodya prolifera JEL478]